MYLWDSLLSAASLAMDAFAVSMCIGAGAAKAPKTSKVSVAGNGAGVRMGFACGVFQLAMPIIGWFAGEYVIGYISAFDHWLAFGLLALVGGNMIRGAFGPPESCAYENDPTKSWALLYLALATSIDALAVGASFAIADRPVTLLAVSAGAITAVLCFAGIRIGGCAGAKMGKKVELAGGLILVLIGLNILREHLL
jgi:putative Mn2+ efflux pump MntP